MKILLIEDDLQMSAYVAKGLRELAHVVETACTGVDGLFRATSEPYDLIIVDRKLPGLDGLTVVKSMRGTGLKTPVLFLTTMSGIGDRVDGLEAGGDDYLVKPFAFSELVARVNALLRRPPLTSAETVLRVGDLEMDLIKRAVVRGSRKIELQPREFKLLEYMMRNAGRVVTRTMLLEHVWDFHFDPHSKVVETHISRLRAKLAAEAETDPIETVRGAGYSLNATA